MSTHKNKTYATFLACTLGGIGIHRFYIYGPKDRFGWIHMSSIFISGLLYWMVHYPIWFFLFLPWMISIISGFIEALVIGLTSDENWDMRYNPGTTTPSGSGWGLVILLIFTFSLGSFFLLTVIARLFDLLLTGGAYG